MAKGKNSELSQMLARMTKQSAETELRERPASSPVDVEAISSPIPSEVPRGEVVNTQTLRKYQQHKEKKLYPVVNHKPKLGRPRQYIASAQDREKYNNGFPERKQTSYELCPELVKQKAKELYIVHGWEKSQLLHLGIPEKVLDVWLYQPTANSLSWSQERLIFKESILKNLKAAKSEEVTQILGYSFNVLKRSLQSLDESGQKLGVSDMQKLANISKELDNIIRLEDGTPTEINQTMAMTKKDVEDLLLQLQKADPFATYELNPDKFKVKR